MQKKEIDSLVFLMKQANEKNNPKPIVFLGAGVSASANIPLAGKIIDQVLSDYKDKPEIIALNENQRKDYYEVMRALTFGERQELFTSYITSKDVKINAAHIYLAQMLDEGYVDYVLTVNFDDLLIRACALYNFIPPIYDLAVLDTLNTSTIQKKSVTYLHGLYYGQWLLNTQDELDTVIKKSLALFNKISDGRPWIFVGYSGQDEVLKAIDSFSNFSNNLYWVGYWDHDPITDVKTMLSQKNKNAFLVSGYDADYFFSKLHKELKLTTPKIFIKPFTLLSEMLSSVNNIEAKPEYEGLDEDTEYQINSIKYFNHLLEGSRLFVDDAVSRYETELGNFEDDMTEEEIRLEAIRQEIRNALLNEDFSLAPELMSKYSSETDEFILELLSALYNDWGRSLILNSKLNIDSTLFDDIFSKFDIAISLNPNNDTAYFNWGNFLHSYADINKIIPFYHTAISKYEKSIELNPSRDSSFVGWGTCLIRIANHYPEQAESMYIECISKFELAISLNPNNSAAFNGCGLAKYLLARIRQNEIDSLCSQAIEDFTQATILNPNNYYAYINWGNALCELGKYKSVPQLFIEGFSKFDTAVSLVDNNLFLYVSWANRLLYFLRIVPEDQKQKILLEAKEKAEKAFELSGRSYNLACCYALLHEKEKAFELLRHSLTKKEITIQHVRKDVDWKAYWKDPDFINLLAEFEAED